MNQNFGQQKITIEQDNFYLELQKKSKQDSLFINDVEYNFELENKTNIKQFYISIVNPILDSAIVEHNGNTIYFGDKVSERNNFRIKGFNDVYSFNLEKGATTSIKIKLKKQKENLNIRMILNAENVFLRTINKDNLFFGIFIGVYFLFILILLSMYIFSRNNFFSKYMYMNILTLLIYLYFSGYGYHYLWNQQVVVQMILPAILFTLYAILHLNFIYTFYNVNNEYKVIKYIIIIYLIILVIFSLSQVVSVLSNNIYMLNYNTFMLLVYLIFLIYMALVAYLSINTYIKTKRIEAIWVLVGIIIQTISWVIFFNNIYYSENIFSKIGNFRLGNSLFFISQINIILIYIEIILTASFITYNYRNIIKQNSFSINRLQFLQQRNLEEYNENIIKTRNEINGFLEKRVLSEIREIKSKFSEYIFFKEINKLNSNIEKNLNQAENELQLIMHDRKNKEESEFGNIVQNIMKELPDNIIKSIEIDRILFHNIYNDYFNIQIKRIIEEIINNILKHSNNKDINIHVKQIDMHIIEISTTNKIDTKTNEIKKGLGLISIEERLTQINGRMDIDIQDDIWQTVIIINTKKFE